MSSEYLNCFTSVPNIFLHLAAAFSLLTFQISQTATTARFFSFADICTIFCNPLLRAPQPRNPMLILSFEPFIEAYDFAEKPIAPIAIPAVPITLFLIKSLRFFMLSFDFLFTKFSSKHTLPLVQGVPGHYDSISTVGLRILHQIWVYDNLALRNEKDHSWVIGKYSLVVAILTVIAKVRPH